MLTQLDWLGHIVEALVMAGFVGLAAMLLYERRIAILIGLAFAGGHFHGREKRDYEISVEMPPPHLDAYLMWRWSWDQMTDFWPAALVILALSIALYRRWFPSRWAREIPLFWEHLRPLARCIATNKENRHGRSHDQQGY